MSSVRSVGLGTNIMYVTYNDFTFFYFITAICIKVFITDLFIHLRRLKDVNQNMLLSGSKRFFIFRLKDKIWTWNASKLYAFNLVAFSLSSELLYSEVET